LFHEIFSIDRGAKLGQATGKCQIFGWIWGVHGHFNTNW